VSSLGLTGEEVFSIEGLSAAVAGGFKDGRLLTVRAKGPDGVKTFQAVARIDTPQEVLYYQHGGILQYVLRQLAGQK
jgi:aconitate hydratase